MLRHNQLSGTLPASWSGMKELNILGLNDNAFSGSLPAQWSAMRKLVNFRLHDNVFDGSLPATWATMSNLDLLFLRNNFLKSSIPPVWFDNSSGSGLLGLQVFDASHNQLTGHIPIGLLNSSELCILLLNDNQFTGRVGAISPSFFRPYCTPAPTRSANGYLGPLPFLPALLLENNRLSCALPSRPANAPTKLNDSAILAQCVAQFPDQSLQRKKENGNHFPTGFRRCQELFNGTGRHYSTMILSGNLFDGPLPKLGNMSDPMWQSAPFLHFDRGTSFNNAIPGFTTIVAYILGGMLLIVQARSFVTSEVFNIDTENRTHDELVDMRFSRLCSLLVPWIGGYACVQLCVSLPAYITGGHYYDCGNPLLHTTSAYLAGAPVQAYITLSAGILTAILSMFFLHKLYGVAALPSRGAASAAATTNARDWSSDVRALPTTHTYVCGICVRAAWAVAWLGATLALCVPTAAYAMSTIIPVPESWWMLRASVHYGAAIYLTLINTLAVPRLAAACTPRVKLPSSWLLLLTRLMTTWLVPVVIIVTLDNSCGQNWVKFWNMCYSGPQRVQEMDIYGP
jgi:hypothetical protein